MASPSEVEETDRAASLCPHKCACGPIGRIAVDLMKLAVPANEGGVQAAHVGRDEAGIHSQGGAHLRYRPAEPDVVHPESASGPAGEPASR